jgi:hypothetical protein
MDRLQILEHEITVDVGYCLYRGEADVRKFIILAIS